MITIDKAKCVGCRLCEKKCPFGAITFKDKYPEISDLCRACGECVEACPTKALALAKKEAAAEGKWKGILVFGEQSGGVIAPVVFELIGNARELAGKLDEKVYCVVLGEAKDPKDLIRYGADAVHLFEHDSLRLYNSEYYANVLADFVMKLRPSIFLIGATSVGRELAPRVSSRLRAGLTADCTVLDIDNDGLLLQTRPAFGGNIMATIISPHARPQMASVRYKVMDKPKPAERKGEVVKEKVREELLEGRIEVLGERKLADEDDIVNANVIVAGGKGMGRKEGFIMLHDLARELRGSVAASRAAVEAGWAQYPIQVGLSGKVVKPELYLACGISGMVQHLSGMETSQVVVAINKDEDAPIFEHADFGIVGDVNEIIPELTAELKRRRKGR